MQMLPLPEGRKQDLIAFLLYFQKIMVQKIPPVGGGGGGFALLAISLEIFMRNGMDHTLVSATFLKSSSVTKENYCNFATLNSK